jgi:muconate cycloisomerase
VSILSLHLAPALKGVDVRRLELLHQAMNRAVRGHFYAKAALEVGILDAVGHSLGLPVYQLLGGKFRDRVEVAHSIGLMDIGVAVDEAVSVAAEGIKTLKLKIGVDPARDVKLVAEIRRAVGDDISIRVDGNQGYGSWRLALDTVLRMEESGIAYAEQLVDGIEELSKIAQHCHVPVMADESVWSERDVVRLAKIGAVQYVSTYYTKPGGLWKAKRLLTVAGANLLQSDINGSGEMGIGNAANLHLAASCPEVTLAGTIPVTSTAEIQRTQTAGRKYLDDIIQEPFVFEEGYLVVPDGPGLGISIDEEKIRRYRIG